MFHLFALLLADTAPPETWKDKVAIAVGSAIVTTCIIGLGKCFIEWRKRIVFHSEQWKVEYPKTEDRTFMGYTTIPTPCKDFSAICSVKVRFFNRKSKSIGLHRFAVVFSTGGWGYWKRFRRDLLRLEDVKHGPQRLIGGHVRHRDDLKELTLVPDDWTPDEIVAYTKDVDSIVASDSTWLVAETAEGKKRRWLLHRENKPGGNDSSQGFGDEIK